MRAMKPYDCGIGPAFEVVGGKWKASILYELSERPLRTSELRRILTGITEKMLIQQLRELEGDGVVHRAVRPGVPLHVEYSLTPEGFALNKALGPIADWGEAHAKRKEAKAKLAS